MSSSSRRPSACSTVTSTAWAPGSTRPRLLSRGRQANLGAGLHQPGLLDAHQVMSRTKRHFLFLALALALVAAAAIGTYVASRQRRGCRPRGPMPTSRRSVISTVVSPDCRWVWWTPRGRSSCRRPKSRPGSRQCGPTSGWPTSDWETSMPPPPRSNARGPSHPRRARLRSWWAVSKRRAAGVTKALRACVAQ